MPQSPNLAQRKRQQLEYRRKIAIVGADLRKAQKAQQLLAMEMRRLLRKRRQIDMQLAEMKQDAKKRENEVRILSAELKRQQKRLDRIS